MGPMDHVWFPESDETDRGGIDAARKRICRECPVLKQCQRYGIENDEYGWWGGLSKNTRTLLRNGTGGRGYRGKAREGEAA